MNASEPPPENSSSSQDGKAAAAWLAATGRAQGARLRLAGGLVIADIIPAVAFAAGLAMAVSGLQTSVGAALPGVLLALGAMIARGMLARAAATAGARAAAAVKDDVRRAVAGDVFSGRRPSDGGATAAVVEGVEALDGYYSRFAPARQAAAVAPLLAIAAAAVASPVTAGILVFTLFPFIVGMILAGTAAAAESRRQFAALERLSSLFLDRVRALPVLLAYQAEARTRADIGRTSEALAHRTGRVLRIAFASSAILEFFSALAVALVAVYCGFNLLRLLPFPVPETLDLGRALFVLALAPEVYAPIRRLAAAYHERQAAEAAVPALIGPRPKADIAAPATLPEGIAPAISLHDVSIAYETDRAVLDGFNLEVAPGEMVAVVGPSGSGKSSLLHLLLGLAPLSAGEARIDGRCLPPGGLAGAVGWSSQAPMVAPGDLAHNIALARPGAEAADIERAARAAGLTLDLSRPIDERGGGLSGGERRRLGLARALLKDAPLLLLDEPTANLDAEAERSLLPVIREAARGRTTLIATHSAALAAMADRVVRL